MYSLVLMAAMSGGPNATGSDQAAPAVAAPIVVGCTGCTGCTGYSTCCGYSAGCCGGGHHFLGLKHGCCGGTVAYSSCHGCCGGFLGHKHSSGCCGGASCFGSCSGYIYNSAWGNCHGCGGFGPTTSFYPGYTTPAYSTPIVTGAAPFFYVGPTTITPPPPVAVPPAKTDEKESKKGASLKFNLPAGATLFVDGAKTTGQGEERTFFTPPLEAGQKYFYDVKAEVVVDGKSIVEEKRVIVEAGADVRETFAKMLAAVAASTNVAGK